MLFALNNINYLNFSSFLITCSLALSNSILASSLPDSAELKTHKVWAEEQLQKQSKSVSLEIKADILQMQGQATEKIEAALQKARELDSNSVLSMDAATDPKDVKNVNKSASQSSNQPSLYIFVSLSMPEASLIQLGHDAKRIGGYLVIRGLKEGSFKKTATAFAKFIQKTGYGLLVDPTLFKKFAVKNVPIFVMANPDVQCAGQQSCPIPLHDKLSGNVTLEYALSRFAESGEITEAKALLKQLGGEGQ